MDPTELRRRLPSADADFLRSALDESLGPAELLLVLRNRRTPAELLARIAAKPRWTARNTIRCALVLHPNTPLATARNLVPYLFWRELVSVATTLHVDPVVRRSAERRLAACLDGLSVGELISFARVAPRALVPPLVSTRDERVARSVLDNPRLVEAEAVAIARRAAPSVAGATARHSRWGHRRDVRLALARNANTPVDVALRIVHALERRDVDRLACDVSVRNVVRIAARRRADRGPANTRAGRA